MQKLTEREIKLADMLRGLGYKVIESYPEERRTLWEFPEKVKD